MKIKNRIIKGVTRSDPCFFRVNTDDNFYNVSFEITNRCNLECKHCFNKSKEDSTEELSKFEILKLIDELANAKIKNVYMTGGEPTQYPYFLEVINAFYDKGIEVILATNGYNISYYYDTIERKISKKSGVYISIDGLENDHNELRGRPDAFQNAISTISLLAKRNIIIRVSSIIWDGNYSYLEKMVCFLKELGVSQINFTIPVNVGRAMENGISLGAPYSEVLKKVNSIQEKFTSEVFKIFLKRQHELGINSLPCQAGQKIMHINSIGEIYPCSWIAKAGLNEYSLRWRPDNLSECINQINDFQNVVSKREELWGYSGCPAMAKIHDNDIFNNDPLNKNLCKE